MLLTIPDVLTAGQVLRARQLLDQADWVDGRATAGHQSALAKDNLQLPEGSPAARELGALVVRLQGTDAVDALLTYARTHGVGHIMIGRSHRPWWQQVLGRSFVARMLKETRDFDLHIVALEDEEPET